MLSLTRSSKRLNAVSTATGAHRRILVRVQTRNSESRVSSEVTMAKYFFKMLINVLSNLSCNNRTFISLFTTIFLPLEEEAW